MKKQSLFTYYMQVVLGFAMQNNDWKWKKKF